MVGPAPANDITEILATAYREGRSPEDAILPHVYEELRRQAEIQMIREAPGLTLQATALVHEAYLRLLIGDAQRWENRRHFLGAAAEAMRRILVERARHARTVKRGGDRKRVHLDGAAGAAGADPLDILALDEALERLAKIDPRAARVVKLRYFIGLSVEETAEVLEVSPRTVKSDWAASKAWLSTALAAR